MLKQPRQPLNVGTLLKNTAIAILVLLCVKPVAGYLGRIGAEKIISTVERKNDNDNSASKMGVVAQVSNEMNKSLPKMTDSLTRLDSTKAALNRFEYNYTLFRTKLESINVAGFLTSVRPLTINQLKGNPFGQLMKDNSITVIHSFYDVNGKFVGRIEISPQEIP